MKLVLAALLALFAAPATAETVDQVAMRYGLAGEVLVGKGDTIVLNRAYGTVVPTGIVPHKPGAQWRLASITKQVVAALILDEFTEPNTIQRSLDMPLGRAFDIPSLGEITLRQMLTHHSGLPNPDATVPRAGGVPDFYTRPVSFDFCLSAKPRSGAPFSYNNCDYIVASLAIIRDRDRIDHLWPAGTRMAKSGEVGVPGFVKGTAEPRFDLSSWFTAGGLLGTARAVFDFDRSLMTGKLLSPPALAELWKPEGNGSYQALGQWVFPGQLKGCAKPKRIVQRDGEIYGVQARNFILPDDDLVVIVFTNRSSDDFAIGEVWEGKGFAYDLLSAAACSA